MAPLEPNLRKSTWQKPMMRCMALTALVYSTCTISELPVADARSSSASAASRSVLTQRNNKHASTDNNTRRSLSPSWSSGVSHIQMLQNRVYSSLLSPEVQKTDVEIVMAKIRGGSSEEESDSDEYDSEEEEEESDADEYDSDSESEEDYDSDSEEEEEAVEAEYDEESDDDEEEEVAVINTKKSKTLKSSILSKSQTEETAVEEVEYDDVLTPPAMQQFVVSIGVMMLSNRIDIMDAKVVRIARFAFVAYLISIQLFLLYVRFKAKATDDRTEITISNPLASLAQNAAGAAGGALGGGNFMVKALADQVLSSTTTVLEYDLKAAKKMNSSLLFPMAFLYFLHFRMKQVQPLLMQTATGFSNLVYSPLFQIYVLGRNLERPFKPPSNPMMEAMQAQQEGGMGADGVEESGSEEEGEKEEEAVSKEEEVSEEEESDDSGEEYDDEYDSDE